MKVRVVVGAVALGAGLLGCAGEETVGSENLLEFDQQEQGGALDFGGATTVPTTVPPDQAAAATTVPVATADTQPIVTTTLPPEQQVVTIEVAINDQSPYFDPTIVNVLVGSRVRFENRGTGTYRVLSDTAAFDSGDIPPGGVWIYEATTPGTFNYSDAGRPFAVGTIQVQ